MISFLSAVFLGKGCFVENSGILLCFVNSITNRAYKTVTKSLKNGNGTNIFHWNAFVRRARQNVFRARLSLPTACKTAENRLNNTVGRRKPMLEKSRFLW